MIRIEANTEKAILFIDDLKGAIGNLRPVFADFHTYMLRRTALTFRNLRRGGNYRGVEWRWFAPQYRRKDGTVIPAEGGVPKMRGDGVVKGRLRHSGTRVRSSSSLAADSSRLRNAALTSVSMTENRLVMDTPIEYAKYQHAMRPFQFFQDPADVNALNRFIQRRISGNAQ